MAPLKPMPAVFIRIVNYTFMGYFQGLVAPKNLSINYKHGSALENGRVAVLSEKNGNLWGGMRVSRLRTDVERNWFEIYRLGHVCHR